MRVLIAGAGWAGLAAAIEVTRLGHHATVIEASHAVGGRARAGFTHEGSVFDNGQHILIGAYSQTLQLMRQIGIDTEKSLLRLPLTLRYPDGSGLQLPDWTQPWFAGADVACGVLRATGWSWRDKLSLLRAADAWRRSQFRCAAHTSVGQLCQSLSPRVMQEMIEPLVVSALNTPAHQASAQVFLNVMRDALFAAPNSTNDRSSTSPTSPTSPTSSSRSASAPSKAVQPIGGSNMLIPTVDLGALFPDAAVAWLGQHGAQVLTGHTLLKVEQTIQWIRRREGDFSYNFDRVILATPVQHSVRIVQASLANSDTGQALSAAPSAKPAQAASHAAHSPNDPSTNHPAAQWLVQATALRHEAIATVYAQVPLGQRSLAKSAELQTAAPSIPTSQIPDPHRPVLHTAQGAPCPVLALRSSAAQPAQFVFDRGPLLGQPGVLAFVVSASQGDAHTLEQQVIAQGRQQLGLAGLQPIKTIVEKRATFACTPGLQRPAMHIPLAGGGLWVCGDYVAGPYPATLEGAIRSGGEAARASVAGLASVPSVPS